MAAVQGWAETAEHRHTSRHIHTEAANEMKVEPPLAFTRPDTNAEKHLMNFLTEMKSGTKVFQHFLAKSNLSQIVEGKIFHSKNFL